MRLRRCIIFGLIITLSTTVFSGCGKYSKTVLTQVDKQIDLGYSWWGNDNRHEYTIAGIKLFEKNFPEFRLSVDYSEWTGYKTKYDMQMRSNTMADIMQVNYAWLSEYGKGKDCKYVDLNDYSGTIKLDNFTKDELSYGTVDGRLVGIPTAINTQTLYYNKTIFDKYGLQIPKTWDDLFAAAKVMKNDNIYPMSGFFQQVLYLMVSYTEQVTGKKFMELDGKVNFEQSDFMIMLQFYKRLIDEKVIPHVEKYAVLDVKTGKYAGTITWISDGENYFGKLIDDGMEIQVGNYLTMDGYKRLGWYNKPATLYSISKNCKTKVAAAEFVNYLVNDADYAKLQGVEKGVPVSTNAYKSLETDGKLNGIQFEAYSKMKLNEAEIELASPYMEDSERVSNYKKIADKYLYGKQSLEDTAKEMTNN